ncbi:MAG: HypC/HybG/HupF family hydrogenase formation chaperone [Methanosarcina flavescens]|jgi:hydrogenase expression/formation protein HypC|uniref:HypC/HybG/HupF family hydrogenase formation chaperone n=1 Tax=Methanosarcina flavescens TaxID=1715806 RepID=A0A660HTL8_9EURY|nr:HypC/HybG/HupF family hydrogenase formation chaperone [Methanosarcina flavescens]AYK15613.1 HypC/HybG/HupF family hydrogenase formation chaperone [Methanosarcina flavescens]NLK33624.1 HypC/HybG/HupF family hydrogenase formation chaperone [Methanosarcina flavescens]
MCIAIPGKIVSVVDESTATVDMGGVRRNVNMNLLGGASESIIGKHVLVHVGYAIAEISEEESEETMRLLKQIAGLEEIDTLESESP